MDRDLFIRHELFDGAERRREHNEGLPLVSVPITLYLAISDRRHISHIDHDFLAGIKGLFRQCAGPSRFRGSASSVAHRKRHLISLTQNPGLLQNRLNIKRFV